MSNTPSFREIQSSVQEILSYKNLFLFKKTSIFAAFAVLFVFIFLSSANAAVLQVFNEDEELVAWNLTADTVTSFGDSQVLEASGKVALRQGEDYLKADFIRYYQATQWVVLKGNVEAKLGEDFMRSDSGEFDLRSRVGWLKHGTVFVDGPHVYFSGERINKHWGDTYTFRDAKVTACDGESPAWSVSAKRASIELDGYSQLWHTQFNVKDFGVGYVPFFVLPAKKKRQSGLLFPEFGSSSKVGSWYSQSAYWAVDESRDVTLTETWFENRGFKHGLEYRHTTDTHRKGWWRLDWLHDSVTARTEDDEKGSFDDDGLVRTNAERYWFRGMYDGFVIDPRWKLKATIDYVSDQNYLREFSQDSGSFSVTRDELDRLFSRDINEHDEDRTSALMVNRDWSRGGIALSAEYNQNVSLGNGNQTSGTDTSLQRLPQLDAYWFKGAVPGTETWAVPLEFDATAQGVYFERNTGTTGSRFRIQPTISAPVVTDYGTITPSFGVMNTLYSINRKDALAADEGELDKNSVTIPVVNVTAFTELANTFSFDDTAFSAEDSPVGSSRWTAIRHSIQPRIAYTNIANVEQHGLPFYDDEDRIRPENELTVSLTNLLTRKRATVVKEGEKSPRKRFSIDYKDVAKLRVEQKYDFREAERESELDRYKRRAFSDTEVELAVGLTDYLSLSSRSFWSPYESRLTRHEHTVTVEHEGWGRLDTSLDFRESIDEYKRQEQDRLKIFKAGLEVAYFTPFTFRTLYRSDIEKSIDLEKTLEVVYTHQCFELIGRASLTPGDENYTMMVKLPGLTF